MYITTQTISQLLYDYNAIEYKASDVFYFNTYKLNPTHNEDDILILYSDEYSSLYKTNKSPCYIIIKKEDNFEPAWNQDTPIILIDDCTKEEVYSLLNEHYYLRLEKYSKQKTELLNIMSNRNSLQSVLIEATNILENPFIVYDNNYSLVAHSVSRTLAVAPAQNVIKNGYANVEVIAEMEKNGLLDYAFKNQKHPTLVKIINGYQKLTVSIYNHDDYVGLLCFFDYVRPIREEDYELVEFIGELTRIYFHTQLTQNNSWTPWDYLFSTLLKQKKQITPAQINRLGITIPKEMKLLVISSAGSFKTLHGNQLKYLQTRIHSRLSSCQQYFLDGYLICLDKSSSLDVYNDKEHWDGFIDELARLNLVCGISQSFRDISKLTIAYDQGVAAFEIGQKKIYKQTIYEYKDVVLPHMLELLNQKYPIENFYHPALLTLLEYDEQYNTNYVEFLIIYLACGNNNNLCAKCFDIHYNSVKYRLNVIQEISNIDIKNIKELMNLYITCQIYVEKHPHILEKYKDFLKELPQTLF